MESLIFLVMPLGAGKSIIGPLLAEHVGREHISLDEKRWSYYREIG